jgi:PAS domain-containing protein
MAQSSTQTPLTLAATFLILTIAATAWTLNRREESTYWVQHTSDVRESLAAARLGVAELKLTLYGGGDRAALIRGIERDVRSVQSLTFDNPRQQARADLLDVAIARLKEDPGAPSGARKILDDMALEEEALMSVRESHEHTSKVLSTASLVLSGSATAILAFLTIAIQRRQKRAHARQSALLASILESMGDGVLATTTEHTFQVANGAAALRRARDGGRHRAERLDGDRSKR